MKARKGMAAAGLMAAASLVGLGLAWNAGLFSGAADARAAESAAMREESARRAELLACTEVYLRHETKEMRVANGETLAGLLTRAGASSTDTNAVLTSIADVYNPRRLRPGQSISLYFQRDDGQARLTGVAFRSEPGASVAANRTLGAVLLDQETHEGRVQEIQRTAYAHPRGVFGETQPLTDFGKRAVLEKAQPHRVALRVLQLRHRLVEDDPQCFPVHLAAACW